MAFRRFRVKSGKFILRNENGKTRYAPGDTFTAFDYQVPEAVRDIIEPLEELKPPMAQGEPMVETAITEPEQQPKTKGKKPVRTDKVEELRPILRDDGMWDVINVVADRKVNDVPMTAEDVAALIPGFTGE